MKYKYYAKRNIIPYKRRKKYRAHGNRAHRTPLNSQIETHIVKRCKHSAWATPALRPSGRGGAVNRLHRKPTHYKQKQEEKRRYRRRKQT